MSVDNVNHPAHYMKGKIECIDIIEEMVADKQGVEAVCVGNAVKYMYRAGLKGDKLEDYKKAAWYINRVIEGFGSY